MADSATNQNSTEDQGSIGSQDSIDTNQFEQRKRDHINLSLDPRTQTRHMSEIDRIDLIHEALPDINLADVDASIERFGQKCPTPMFVSSMTAGHSDGVSLNRIMAEVCSERGWLMGVGSQRRELSDTSAANEWKEIRKSAPNVGFIGNLGVSQLIHTETDDVRRLIDNLQAKALFIHLNPLQECLQPEGTPQFKGGLAAIENLCSKLEIPVIIKETGCGFSESTLNRLIGLGVFAVDLSGLGGTHWGRIEGFRSSEEQKLYHVADTFKNWGISTLNSLLAVQSISADYEVWASGGVRSGLDAAKFIAAGATMVGLAKPIIEAATQGSTALHQKMEILEYEFTTALFCTGSSRPQELQEKSKWQVRKI